MNPRPEALLKEVQDSLDAAPKADVQKCTCKIANAHNTAAVRKGYEMGGYVLEKCATCLAAPQPSDDVAKDAAIGLMVESTVKDSLTDGAAQMARDSAELRRLCAERDQLKAENERLSGLAKHYSTLNFQLVNEKADMRKQLGEARELLDLVRDTVNDAANDARRDTRKMIYQEQVLKIDAWLEANK